MGSDMAPRSSAPREHGQRRGASDKTTKKGENATVAPMRLSSLKRALACSAVAWSVVGCGAHAPRGVPAVTPAEGSIHPPSLEDDAFAGSVHTLLLDRGSPARASLLEQVISRQLANAAERFEAGFPERGLASLRGAIYLAGPGELPREVLAANDPLLEAALRVVAPQGDEGAAYALLKLRASILPEGSSARAEVDEQLRALERWLEDIRTGSPIEIAGHDQRVATARALLEPTIEAGDAAREATTAWMDRAIAFSEDSRHGFMRPKREETVQAFRAFRSGAKSLVALSLRHGDAMAAISDIERSSARRMISQEMYERLDRAANGGDARAFRALLAALLEGAGADEDEREDPELALDPELLRAAAWGTALEVVRRDPSALDAAVPLALMASQLGLPEVAPLILLDGVTNRPEPQVVSAALGIVMQAIATEDEADDTASARRIFRAAEPLLALAEREELRGKLRPSPARVRMVMAGVESKAGQLAAARTLFESASKEEPTAEAWFMLSAIEKQAGNLSAALDHLDRALVTSQAKQDPFIEGEMLLARSDLLRDSNQEEAAGSELARALEKALFAQAKARQALVRSRAESLLARVLERYGDTSGAARAIERAFREAQEDKHQIAAIAIDCAARALVRKDVEAARFALSRALDAKVDENDVVYVALWLSLVEKATKTKPDGSAAKALAGIQDERWAGRLASWGLGKLKDQELIDSARTPSQKTEAVFYAAMARRIAGELGESEKSLREIAKSANIDLVEVRIARELTDPPKPLSGGLPKGTKIP